MSSPPPGPQPIVLLLIPVLVCAGLTYAAAMSQQWNVAALFFLLTISLLWVALSQNAPATNHIRGHTRATKAILARTPADLPEMDPYELEEHVAQVLDALPGWQASTTTASADQGADVIAVSPEGNRVAIQVKHYKSSVGNKAVQEIVAAKAFYDCTFAIVFTSGRGYTKSARALAKANGVLLWLTKDLMHLQDLANKQELPSEDWLPA